MTSNFHLIPLPLRERAGEGVKAQQSAPTSPHPPTSPSKGEGESRGVPLKEKEPKTLPVRKKTASQREGSNFSPSGNPKIETTFRPLWAVF